MSFLKNAFDIPEVYNIIFHMNIKFWIYPDILLKFRISLSNCTSLIQIGLGTSMSSLVQVCGLFRGTGLHNTKIFFRQFGCSFSVTAILFYCY